MELLKNDENFQVPEASMYEKIKDFMYLGATLCTKNNWAKETSIRLRRKSVFRIDLILGI